MSRFQMRMALPLAILVLAGCASRPAGPSVPPGEAQARHAARVQTLRAQPQWGIEGRIAVSTGNQGGSGRIEWRQHGQRFDVVLSAPVTRQSWRLSGEPGRARLEGVDGGPRVGTDAGELLREATRWDIPVGAMASWLRGMEAPGGGSSLDFASDGRLRRLVQHGWSIDYSWPPSTVAGGLALPTRIEARRDSARVRLAVDRWTDGSEAP
jgi:outer membrane lipoprotein LolB